MTSSGVKTAMSRLRGSRSRSTLSAGLTFRSQTRCAAADPVQHGDQLVVGPRAYRQGGAPALDVARGHRLQRPVTERGKDVGVQIERYSSASTA
jgi:hypothetical protein